MSSTMTPIEGSALFLVSGGARGVTAQCAIALAARYRCRFLLLGRTAPLDVEPAWAAGCTGERELKHRLAADLAGHNGQITPAALQRQVALLLAGREVAATLHAIARAGGQAQYLPVDLLDADAVRCTLRSALAHQGPVTGILHGAGVLADKPIERKTPVDFVAVYGVKVRGLAHLLACVPLERLAYLVLFSSAVGFFGNPGQADYAMANETLNKLAYQVKYAHPHCRVVSLDWGPWDGGMVTPEVKRRLAERGVQAIAPAAGAQALIDTLERRDGAVQVVVGDPWSTLPRARAGAVSTHRMRRHLTLAANPFLRDHRLGGRPVLPFVCAATWFVNACEDLYPGYTACSLDDLQALKGIVFDETLADSYVLEVREIGRDSATGTIVTEGLIESIAPDGRPRYHYRTRLTLSARPPEAPVAPGIDLTEDGSALDGTALYRDGLLFHGPLFHGVQRVLHCTPSGITALCRAETADAATQGQFPIRTLNPFQADAQLQVMLVWTRLQQGLPGLPARGRRFELFRPVPAGRPFYVSITIRARQAHRVIADLATHDQEGCLYTCLAGAEFVVSAQLNQSLQEAMHP